MIVLTKHVKDRIRERGISKRDLEKVLLNPDKIRA